MPLECALDYAGSLGIKGSNTKAGRADTSVVVELEHEVFLPTDPQTGQLTGSRVHRPLGLIKEIDAATPLLYKACCQGEVLPSVVVNWYHITDAGAEEIYYTTTLTNVRVTSVKNVLPNTKETAEQGKKHLEELQLRYEQVQWEFIDGGIIHVDAWTEPV